MGIAQHLKDLRLRDNVYVVLFLRLSLLLVLYAICRVGFYYYNTEYFPNLVWGKMLRLLAGGFVFDLSTVLYINALYIFLVVIPLRIRFHYYYRLGLKYLFFITNGIALAANVSDFIYYRFTLRRTTADVFLQFQNENNMGGLWMKFFIDYWYAAVFWVFLMILMIFGYNQLKFKGPQLKNMRVFYIAGVLAVPLIAYLMIGGMRGGFRHSTRPITLSNAGEYVEDPKHISIVLNTPFAIIRTVGKTKIQRVKYFTEDEVERIYTPVHLPRDTGRFIPRNVVIIILESFSKEFVGALNREKHDGTYKGYTPFLDSLIQHSLSFSHSFANGRKSIDGLPSVVSSIPSLGTPYFLSPYSGNTINSFASLLKGKGYHSAFFHGAPNGSMGFQAFMNIAGVKEYYGMNEYNNDRDFDGLWGIWDEKFFDFFATKMNDFTEPFFSAVFSLSSHHPFRVPAEYAGKFKGGPLVIHKCVEYSDYSLRKFFEKASKMSWYENTVFVITADHTSSEIEFPETRTAWGFYSVPVIYFTPDHSLLGINTQITQQIDILPTVLGYLDFDEPFVAFGNDVFNAPEDAFAVNYKDNNYQLFSGDYLLQFDGAKSEGLYQFKTDKLLKENLATQNPEIVAVMEEKMKAIIQQYNNRLIEDRLVVK